MKTYRDLLVWQKSMNLVTDIYKLTRSFPREEMFGLAGQIRRASVAIPSNIAEGYGRNSTQDYLRFLRFASGSLYELQTQLEISYNLNYVDQGEYDRLSGLSREIERMLNSLISKIDK